MPSFLSIVFVQGVVRAVLAAVGVGFVSYIGANALLDSVYANVQGNFEGLPQKMVMLLSLLKVDICISLMFSAYSAKLSIYSLKKLKLL